MAFIRITGRYSTALLLVFSILFLLSCGSGRKSTKGKKHVTLDAIQVNAANNPIDIYRATPTREWEITHTRVALSFDWKEKTAHGQEWINLHPYCYVTDSLVLDAKSMKIDSVRLEGQGSVGLTYACKDDQIKIKFNKTYSDIDGIRLYIVYTAMPYAEAAGGSAAITEDRGLYFINTDGGIPNKPRQIWTQGETEANSHWLPTIDKPTTRFTLQLELEVPDTMQTLGNGYLATSSADPRRPGFRKDIWIMDKPIQAYAAMFAIGKFSIVKDSWQGKDVNYYVEKEYEPYAKLMFRNTPEMIDYFSNVTGVSYPWNKYDQVVVRDYVSGAMENTSASLFGEFMNQNAREIADHDHEDIVSHELFHMWFGDYVTCESWSNLTLNESFATYGEYLWRNYKYGKNSADRLHYFNLLKYLDQAKRNDPPLQRFFYADREDMFDRVSYEKGSVILHYLHCLAGDDPFNKAMQLYLSKNALNSAEVAQWRLAVEEATGKDWSWFFNEWYKRGGHPVLDIKYDYDDQAAKLTVTVTQKQDSGKYTLPFKTAILYPNEMQVVDWNITATKQTFTYQYHNNERPTVIPDVLHWVPAEIHEAGKPLAQWRTQYDVGSDYITRRLAIDAAYNKVSNDTAISIIDKALAERLSYVRTYALRPLLKVTDDQLQRHWHSQVEFLAANDEDKEVRATAFSVLAEWKDGAVKDDMVRSVGDSSYNVAGNALKALHKVDEDDAYTLAKKMLGTAPKAELEDAVWDAISARADTADFAIYEARATYLYGGKKLSLFASLSNYLEHVKSDNIFEKGLALMQRTTTAEASKNYRYYMVYYMIELGKTYKQKKDTPQTRERLALVKRSTQQLIDGEKDADTKKKDNDLMKEAFGGSK